MIEGVRTLPFILVFVGSVICFVAGGLDQSESLTRMITQGVGFGMCLIACRTNREEPNDCQRKPRNAGEQ